MIGEAPAFPPTEMDGDAVVLDIDLSASGLGHFLTVCALQCPLPADLAGVTVPAVVTVVAMSESRAAANAVATAISDSRKEARH